MHGRKQREEISLLVFKKRERGRTRTFGEEKRSLQAIKTGVLKRGAGEMGETLTIFEKRSGYG